jgi:DsbC/DsbD-like thiol-disulfide interchange protein
LAVLLPVLPAAAGGGLATQWQHGHGSSTRLIVGSRPDPTGAVRLIAGVEIKLAEGWKTYWRQPGDSGGIPPRFDWSGSVNLAMARVLYPAPERLKDPTGESIGYKKTVVFPLELTAADPARPIVLRLALEYGICRDICVPAEARFEALIAPGAVTLLQPELAAALARVPRPVEAGGSAAPVLVRAAARLIGSAPTLTFEVEVPGGAAGVDLFVEAPDGVYLPMPARIAQPAPDKVLFAIDVGRGVDIERLRGAALKLSIISADGAVETSWKVE